MKMLEEKKSRNLGVNYVYLSGQGKFVCENGVVFTKEELEKGVVMSEEYERRAKEDMLYDYNYAKSTGLLRKKRGTAKTEKAMEKVQEQTSSILDTNRNFSYRDNRREEQRKVSVGIPDREVMDRRAGNKSVILIIVLLAFTSVISMYVSTLHTATYLTDYADVFSAWLMSASVTAYNSTAFEVSVLFKQRRRYALAGVFIILWTVVTLFSMATTVSVFYDSFNFNEYQISTENKEADSNRLALELLQKKEADLRESISFKKKDIEYRQEHDYATTAVRNELNALQDELQENLSEQQKILEETPEVTDNTITRKESLFTFLGRVMHLEGGILEFTMSTLSAVFVNLIAPLSMVAVTELLKKEKENEVRT